MFTAVRFSCRGKKKQAGMQGIRKKRRREEEAKETRSRSGLGGRAAGATASLAF
jgi:hypothetical protein